MTMDWNGFDWCVYLNSSTNSGRSCSIEATSLSFINLYFRLEEPICSQNSKLLILFPVKPHMMTLGFSLYRVSSHKRYMLRYLFRNIISYPTWFIKFPFISSFVYCSLEGLPIFILNIIFVCGFYKGKYRFR